MSDMSHYGNYMDGVPVKISEKYKRPPRIELPYSVIECPSRAQSVVENVNYCYTFERNVLIKLKELRSAKETKKNERRHRLQLLEEAKQKKLDAIAAAEAEEKLKQLSVSDVSYPSTDEISAISPDEKAERGCDNTPTQEDMPEICETSTADVKYPSCSNTADSQTNILQPIQVQARYQQDSLLDDPDPLQGLKMNTKIAKIPQYSNMEMLTFKDFENDTSSPFDNVELKTINDMELLAQVLQGQREAGTSHPQTYVPEQYTALPNCADRAQSEGIAFAPNAYVDQPGQGAVCFTSPQHYPISNGYYVPTENTCDNMPAENYNMYMPNYQYYVPTNPYHLDMTYYNTQNSDMNTTQADGSMYIPQPYYYQYPQMQMQYPPSVTTYSPPRPNAEAIDQNTLSSHTIKSRSRSVPDIVKELDDELTSAKLRTNERSYNASPAPKDIPQSTSSNNRKDEKRSRRKSEHLPNPFSKLSPKLQDICQKIHSMGFPLDRVARVCTMIGDNDKKVIEGLLIMGELMDLGFSESKVSAALAKHEFNRDKALDELVS